MNKTYSTQLLLLLIIIISGCVDRKPSGPKKLRLPHQVTVADLVSSQTLNHNKRSTKNVPDIFSGNKSDLTRCLKAVKIISQTLRKLKKTSRWVIKNKKSVAHLMSRLTFGHCQSTHMHSHLVAVKKSINSHSKTVGIIIPLSGQYAQLGKSILEGIKKASSRQNLNFHEHFIVRDSAGNSEKALKAYAELIFEHEITMIIGGVTDSEAMVLAPYAQKLFTSFLMLNKKSDLVKNFKNVFQIFPTERHLASTLALAARQKGFQRIAILEPNHSRSSLLINEFKKQLKSYGIKTRQQIKYTSGDYSSMEYAAEAISGTNIDHRAEDYKQLYNEEKNKAKEENRAFNPRMLVLKPKLQVDAVFIPDHFRIVRHFVKLFKYHGIEQMPLLGHQEWRVKSIVYPWDQFLEHAFFVDYTGLYHQLPSRKSSNTAAYFLDPKDIIPTDFRLIGYRAGWISAKIVGIPFIKKYKVGETLKDLKGKDQYFGSSSVFDHNRIAFWPTFVFSLHENGISMLASNNGNKIN